jgi:hypothetical protein
MSKRTFDVDRYGWVIARLPGGGMLRSQSVEALLLFELLRLAEDTAGRGRSLTAELPSVSSTPSQTGGQ